MIIDFKANGPHASRFRIVDLDTGEDVPLPVWYADDEAGEFRTYVEQNGHFLKGPDGGPVSESHHGRIKIVPRTSS